MSFLREAYSRAGEPSLRDLGNQIGTSHTTIRAALSGDRIPSWKVAKDLAEHLDADATLTRRLWVDARRNVTRVPAPEAALDRRNHLVHQLTEAVSPIVSEAPAQTDYQQAKVELSQALSQALTMAGRPNYRLLAERMDTSKTTLSRMLNGKVTPSREMLLRFANAIEVDDETVDSTWIPLWQRAIAARDGAGDIALDATNTGHKCPACGAWVLDTAMHDRWHASLDTARSNVEQGWIQSGGVEVQYRDDHVAMRSPHNTSAELLFSRREWDAFIDGIQNGEFRRPDQ
ncbi:helix-turn-helix transcriptional regulator [Actinoplanes philippinensis]|uniref:helix-turn-helix transcriptional regulator n=1 Tax=Actinoplanes philippinensis TaxID=35752 RepID=UPI0033E85F24